MSKAVAIDGQGGRRSARLFERRTRVMKALAHPSRLAMVDALAGGEKCVCDLQAFVGADMSTVSKHLSLLRNAGLVLSSKRGLQVWYRLRVPCLLDFFSCVDAVFADPDADRVDVPLPGRRGTREACSGACAPSRKRPGSATGRTR
jgi:DNA-binding transcriptional ArsR family regulator